MKEQKNKKGTGRVVGLAVLVAAIGSTFFVDWKKEASATIEPVRPLKTMVIAESATEKTYTYLGVIEATETANLSFEVSGMLLELNAKKGQLVSKGDVLAKLDPRDFQNERAVAQAAADQARINLERIRPAVASGAIGKQQLTDAEALYSSTTARLAVAKKAVENTELIASFDGIIADVTVENFEGISAKQEILVLQATDSVDITVNVPESRAAQVDPSRAPADLSSRFKATLDYFPERNFDVTLSEFKLQADSLTMTYKVTFTMTRPKNLTLLPGMPATITEYKPVVASNKNGFLLPADSVPIDTNGDYFVWKLTDANDGEFTVNKVTVKAGQFFGDSIEVTGGVTPGDRIATAGVHILQENQRVRLFNDEGVSK